MYISSVRSFLREDNRGNNLEGGEGKTIDEIRGCFVKAYREFRKCIFYLEICKIYERREEE